MKFGGADSVRPSVIIDAEEFIGVKGFKAKGKRISNYTIGSLEELEPTRFPEPPVEDVVAIDTEEEDEPENDIPKIKVVQGELFDFNEDEDKTEDNESTDK